MKVALIHYWLIGMRGGERVLEALCRMFPDADIFTHVVNPDSISKTIARHRIHTTFISRLPMAQSLYQKYLPLMPYALEALDLSAYDLVISSEAGPAKGIIPPLNAPHICYCHSPMRYIWDQYHIYSQRAGPVTRAMMLPLSHRLRIWDESSAARVDQFIANSRHVQKRIGKFYRRESVVIPPPVAIEAFSPAPPQEIGDYYLWAGELVSYKRPDMAIEAFRKNGRKLMVIGEGPERRALERVSGDNITFLGKVPFATLKHHLARCKALIFPGEEDFGIIPVEAQASGRPVIALGRGGILDTVVHGETGILYDTVDADSLNAAIESFEANGSTADYRDACVRQAGKFSERAFREALIGVGQSLGIKLGGAD